MAKKELPPEPKLGIYRHYKGSLYRVLCVALHSESQEKLVVYHALCEQERIWVRPLEMFSEMVMIGEQKVQRFEYMHAD